LRGGGAGRGQTAGGRSGARARGAHGAQGMASPCDPGKVLPAPHYQPGSRPTPPHPPATLGARPGRWPLPPPCAERGGGCHPTLQPRLRDGRADGAGHAAPRFGDPATAECRLRPAAVHTLGPRVRVGLNWPAIGGDAAMAGGRGSRRAHRRRGGIFWRPAPPDGGPGAPLPARVPRPGVGRAARGPRRSPSRTAPSRPPVPGAGAGSGAGRAPGARGACPSHTQPGEAGRPGQICGVRGLWGSQRRRKRTLIISACP
jgi:hypothetical protein